MLHSIIYNTSQICSQLGVKHAIMSPGSRNAPLTISFARHQSIKKYIIPDERTAGFIALGIAQKTQDPVVLCCTSGTALLNYAPAIAEAFYREIPLIILSADRPPYMIDQRDGQTIRQYKAVSNHVKASYQLPLVSCEEESTQYQDQLIEGLQLSTKLPFGPVHLNIPFEEPFYPTENDELTFKQFDINIWKKAPFEKCNLTIPVGKKVLILVGQHVYNKDLSASLLDIESLVPVINSPLNNLQLKGIDYLDAFIDNQKELVPDILITYGLSILSKKLKNFIRSNKPSQHFHFDPAGIEVDTYETTPLLIRSSLQEALSEIDFSGVDRSYVEKWSSFSSSSEAAIQHYLSTSLYSETSSFNIVLKSLPNHCHLHLGNSMPVRFADLFGVHSEIETWSNRGTSGIDGCTSTAVGSSLISNELNVLLTGDVSFFYDNNAFFHNYALPNLRIIIFNNQGGGIFRLIDGPANLPELEDYFETRHNRSAKYICLDNDLAYSQAHSLEEVKNELKTFYESSDNAKILEVFTDPATNQQEYKKLKQYIYEQIRN